MDQHSITGTFGVKTIHTRERILDKAEQLIAQKGVYGLQLKDIAEPLNIRVPAIYKHYKNRDAILIAVSKRFITQLAQQFQYEPSSDAIEGLRTVLDSFVDFKIMHPAYVRLSLIDFATPKGGMDYVKIAAGGSFTENLTQGPLAKMHKRLQTLLEEGHHQGYFRPCDPVDFYRLVYSGVILQLVFPNDRLLTAPADQKSIYLVKESLRNLCLRYLCW
ncbi:MAG: hypothetical protein OFPII_01610 [Osedax symbiont Rs1]|nr:MAG: hypothetical protein OFPII_01610 [Osedax symbiont Rs1]